MAPARHAAADTRLRHRAAEVRCELEAQDAAWGTSGWTRRSFLAGAGMAGVAALGTQLVTTRAAYAAAPSTDDTTLVVIFMRAGADGLRILTPNSSSLGLDYLQQVRPKLLPTDSIALPGQQGWALNGALRPLYNKLWASDEMAFVPAVSLPGVSRSHFQAQQYLEHGGSDHSSVGWLDRTLANLGPGTTFRAVSEGAATPTSMAGNIAPITLMDIDQFKFPSSDAMMAGSEDAVATLYRNIDTTLGTDVPLTLDALKVARQVQNDVKPGASYPNGNFGDSLKNLAMLLKAEVGMQVATVDVGGWDTHTNEVQDLDKALGQVSETLCAFMDDLGPTRRKRVTVALMTEFGRRVEMNASGGTDHGHGSVMWVLGGGVRNSGVYGKWNRLSASVLDEGDVPGLNNPFDVLGELLQTRLNVSTNGVFLDSSGGAYRPSPLQLSTTN